MPVSPDIRKRMLYAKYLLSRARRARDESNELGAAAALLLMHDAVEMVMLSITDHLQVSLPKKWDFMDFWAEIKKNHPEPPQRIMMDSMNKMRVGLKHNGIIPNKTKVHDLLPRVEAFCEDVAKSYLDGMVLTELSLADLVSTAEVRNKLNEAQKAFASGDKENASISLRVAFNKLYKLLTKDVALVKSPIRSRVLRGPLPDEARKWLTELQGTVSDLVIGLNVVMLGIDPARYRLLMISTPSVSESLSGNVQAVFSPFHSAVPDEVFNECFEFVVDVALNASR